ncbi:MAG: ABC transporter ATP-binding protein [Solobacterium sp.]|nr:ABC transporter ATP-binding protein [Solobacterium sp.]
MNRRQFLSKYLRGNRWRFACVAVFAVFAVFLGLLIPLIFGFFIDYVIDSQPLSGRVNIMIAEMFGGTAWLREHLLAGGVMIAGVYLLQSVFLFLRGYLSGRMSEDMAARIRRDLYSHLQRLPYEYPVRTKTGDLVQRCTTDVDIIRRVMGQQFQHMIRSLCTVLIACTVLFGLHRRMAFKAVILMPVLFLYAYYFYKRNQKAFLASDESEGRMTTVIQENLNGIRVIKAFGRERYEINRFRDYNEDFRDRTFAMIKLLGRYWSSSDLICLLQTLIVLFAGIQEARAGTLTIGNFMVFMSYESMILWPIRQLGRILSDIGKSGVSIDRLNEILNEPEEDMTSGERPELSGDIVFDHLSFRYGEEESPVLDDVSLHIRPGETIALMGPTGAGKSTLVHLLTRLYDYENGSIRLDGVELNQINRQYLRQKVGIVLQEPFLFSRTIYENIHLGRDAGEKEVETAASIAAVHEVINEFEQGYSTLVGEKGVTLSGGQKQRIAIARTLMNDSRILIFDDSLSAVDARTDRQIRQALKEHGRNITTIIITQRINSARDADRIIVLEHGRITQDGTHDELIRQDGLYRRIYEIQSSYAETEAEYEPDPV